MSDTIKTMEAIQSLRNDAQCVVREIEGISVIEWLDDNQSQPTDVEIQDEIVRLQSEYDANKYQRDRKPEYPSMADQLDYIYHNGIAKWKSDMVKPVKDAHPKP